MALTKWTPRPQETKSAPNYVIDQVRSALYTRELKPGERLPSETELTEMFGVSRGYVRQAMKSLESLGVVTIRPGDGTYVNTQLCENNFNPLAFALLLSNPSKKTLMDARYALERDILELIMADDSKVAAVIPLLEANVREREDLLSSGSSIPELVKNDQEFHLILSTASDNLFLKIVYDYIVDAFRQSIENAILRLTPSGDTALRDHVALLAALKNGSFSEAKEASRQSIESWRLNTSDDREATGQG